MASSPKKVPAAFACHRVRPPERDAETMLGTAAPPSRLVFGDVESALAEAKTQMDPYSTRQSLTDLLRAIDMFAGLRPTIGKTYNGQAVTNAWLKMYELLWQMRLVDHAVRDNGDPLRVFFNAELPGGFLCAVNHFVATQTPGIELKWVASSLYPWESPRTTHYGPADVLGDYYGLYAGNPDRWLMDAEMRGDVTSPADADALCARAAERLGGAADLYVADAGINVGGAYNRQEELAAQVNLGQLYVGLVSLRPGGTLVAKTYTFTRAMSVGLIVVCASLFENFYVTKPRASRPVNSEVYLVGTGFRGVSRAVLAALRGALERRRPRVSGVAGVAQHPGAQKSVESLRRIAQELHVRYQISYIREALHLYRLYRRRIRELRSHLQAEAAQASASWLEDNPVAPLRAVARLPVAPRADR